MDKKAVYKFLEELVDQYPGDAVPMLQDIIVDYMLFPQSGSSRALMQMWEVEVVEMLKDPAKKIPAIKIIRERTGMGLADAKTASEQVMSGQIVKPTDYSTGMFNAGRMALAGISSRGVGSTFENSGVKAVIDRIRKDYNMME